MTRTLHVSDVFRPQVGGIEIFVDGLARRQAAAGDDVTVLTSTRSSDAGDDSLAVLRVGPLPRLRPRDVEDFDVVHAHLSVVSPLATSVARTACAAGVPTVMSVHSMWSDRLAVVRAVSAVAGWRHSPAVWAAVSAAAAEGVRRSLPGKAVFVVPNAIDVGWWRDVEWVPRDNVMVLSVMRLADRKRPLPLLKMLREVHRRTHTTRLRAVIVGSGPLEPSLRRWLRRHQMDSWVTLAGTLTPAEIRSLCATSDLYVAPAIHESFGIAALEARTAGLPVVAMRNGGVGEFVRHGVEGLLCNDDGDMVDAITRLVIDVRLRTAIAAHNVSVAPSTDWTQALERFESVYDLAARGEALRPARRTRRPAVYLYP